MASRKQSRGCLQISLRTAFIGVTCLCFWFGTVARRAVYQQRGADWVNQNHGRIWYDYQYDGTRRPPGSNNVAPPGPTWLRELIGIDYLAKTRSVEMAAGFSRTQSNHAKRGIDLSPIGGMFELQELRIERSSISDVTPLRRLRKLRRLYLGYSDVNDVTPLANLTNLTHLSLNNTKVVNVSPLSKLTNLATLSLHNTKVTQQDYQALKKALPKCKIVWSDGR